jgi:hypothetical protein
MKLLTQMQEMCPCLYLIENSQRPQREHLARPLLRECIEATDVINTARTLLNFPLTDHTTYFHSYRFA